MSTLRNKVQLIGNLGNQPEVITLESGKKLAKFTMATNENYKNAIIKMKTIISLLLIEANS